VAVSEGEREAEAEQVLQGLESSTKDFLYSQGV
jgi:hypothetical protein